MQKIDFTKLRDEQLLDYCLYSSSDLQLRQCAKLLEYATLGDQEKIASTLHKVLFDGASLYAYYPAIDDKNSIVDMSFVGDIPDGALYLALV